MARIRIEDIIAHLDREMSQALEAAVRHTLPTAQFDSSQLYEAFSWAVRRLCRTWETVPDRLVEVPKPTAKEARPLAAKVSPQLTDGRPRLTDLGWK
jgi:hypothetical protein